MSDVFSTRGYTPPRAWRPARMTWVEPPEWSREDDLDRDIAAAEHMASLAPLDEYQQIDPDDWKANRDRP